MSAKRKWGFNSSVTQHYGLLCLLTGSLGGLAGMTYWLYKVWTGASEFSWLTFSGITILSLLLAVIGYILLRIEYEQGKD